MDRQPSYNHTTPQTLEEQFSRLSWDEIKGKVVYYVSEKSLSLLLMKKFELGNMEGIKMVVSEIKEGIFQILFKQTGSQFFLKLLDILDHHDITELLKAVTANQHQFVEICCNDQGARAVQKLISFLDENNVEEKVMILDAIRGVAVKLSTHMNGYQVIEELLKTFRGVYDVIGPLLGEIADHSLDLAMDRRGCTVLLHCLKAQGAERDHILHQIIAHAFDLAMNDYGNYVVQYVLELKDPHVTSQVIRRLEGNFVNLTKNRWGSHVVERCLKVVDDEHVNLIVNEVLDFTIFLEICQHPYGHFVVQTLYGVIKDMQGEASRLQHQKILHIISEHYPFLHSHMYGKKVLSHMNSSKLRVSQ